MKGKEALSAARRRIEHLEAELRTSAAFHRKQIESLRAQMQEKDASAQRSLSEVSAALRHDVAVVSSERVRDLEAEVAQLTLATADFRHQAELDQEVVRKIVAAFQKELERQGMTPHESFEAVLNRSQLMPSGRQTTIRSRTTHVEKSAAAARLIEMARGIRSAPGWSTDVADDGFDPDIWPGGTIKSGG